MKYLSITFMMLSLSLSAPAQGFLHLTNGQSFSYTFSSLDFIQSGALLLQGGGVAFYRLQLPGPSDQVLVELFENSVTELPVASRLLTGQVGDSFSQNLIWQDLQGAVRITALNAPIDLTGLQFSVATGPLDFNFYRSFVAVPEPDTLGLFTMGCVVLEWFIRPKRNGRRLL